MADKPTEALTAHEVSHALMNIYMGCQSVTIQKDGDGLATLPQWGPDVTPTIILSGLMAGRLCLDGVDNSDDEMLIANFPSEMQVAAQLVVDAFAEHIHEVIGQMRNNGSLSGLAAVLDKAGEFTMGAEQCEQLRQSRIKH